MLRAKGNLIKSVIYRYQYIILKVANSIYTVNCISKINTDTLEIKKNNFKTGQKISTVFFLRHVSHITNLKKYVTEVVASNLTAKHKLITAGLHRRFARIKRLLLL